MKLTQNKKMKPGMTLIELTVVILVLLTLISVLFIGAQAYKKGADRAACILNIRNVQQAVRSEQNTNEKIPGDSGLVAANIMNATGDKYMVTPSCPGGGTYTAIPASYPAIGVAATACSLAGSDGHVPKSLAGW